MRSKIMVGVDPDVDLNGVCSVCHSKAGRKDLRLYSKRFFDLCEYLQYLHDVCDLFVVIEGGHLNAKSNFRSEKMNSKSSDQVSRQVGRNHQTGILLGEFCDKHHIPYEYHIPRSKTIKQCIESADLFRSITRYDGLSNKETRSAAMLVYERGWPINIKKTPNK